VYSGGSQEPVQGLRANPQFLRKRKKARLSRISAPQIASFSATSEDPESEETEEGKRKAGKRREGKKGREEGKVSQ